jgi:putative oxidoreductase
MTFGRLAARAVIGGLFIGHGAQKLFGSFGGPGIEGFAKVAESLELRPGTANAYAAGLSELGGGALLAAGAATPLAASILIGTMITAIRKVHLSNGIWVTNGGFEYNLVLIAAVLAIVDAGPGTHAVDSGERSGALWALGALALGAAASTATIEAGKRAKPAPADPAADGFAA